MAPGPGSRLRRAPPSSRYRPPDAASCLATMNRAPAVPMDVTFMSSPPHPVGRSARTATRSRPGGDDHLGNFGERCFGLRSEVALVQLSYAIQRVDLLDRLVVADAHDAGKAQGITAGLAAPILNRIEPALEPHPWPHAPRPAPF